MQTIAAQLAIGLLFSDEELLESEEKSGEPFDMRAILPQSRSGPFACLRPRVFRPNRDAMQARALAGHRLATMGSTEWGQLSR
jgi:hypothetical protein